MKLKPILTLISIIVLLLAAATAYIWLTAPQRIEAHIRTVFAEAGFENVTLPPPQTGMGVMIYKNIQLDKDAFSTIKTLRLHYSLLSSITGKHLDSLIIDGLNLTGELHEEGQITLAGWNGGVSGLKNKWPLTARNIRFENTSLSLLSEDWGGITFRGEAQFRPTRKNIGFQARIEGAQRQLSANTRIEGQITPEGFWEARVELEQGKFEIDDIRATRLSGLITLSGQGTHATQIISELQAGGLSIFGLPWHNASITIDGTPATPRLVLAAKSLGFEGLELGINIENLNFPSALSGQLHIDTLSNAFDYLNSQNALPVDRKTLAALDPLSNLQVDFTNLDGLNFNIKKEDQEINIKGKINKTDEGYTGEFLSDPIALTQRQSGNIVLKGTFSKQKETLNGQASFVFKDAGLHFGAIPVTLNETTLPIDDLKTLSGPSAKEQPCRVTGLNIENTCTLTAQVKNANPDFSNLEIKGPGFNIYAPQAGKITDKTLLSIKELDLTPLLSLFGNDNWKGTGLFEGTLSMTRENGALKLNTLYLKNKGVGILRLRDNKLFEMMDMEELEKETMKLALENFQYDLLEIKAEGSAPDRIKFSVFGKGKNPYLMQGRQFSIDFEITPDLAPLLSKVFSKQAGQ